MHLKISHMQDNYCLSPFVSKTCPYFTKAAGPPRELMFSVTQNDPLTQKSGQIKLGLACEQEQGKERGRGKREHVGMAKDFNFQMPVIYFMLKLTIWVASTTTANFESIRQLQSWVSTTFYKIRKSFTSSNV